MTGVWPNSPPRRDTFSLVVRLAVRLRRGTRAGSYVVRQSLTLTILAYFAGSNGREAMPNRGPCAEADATTTSQTTAQSNCAERRPDLATNGGRGRPSVDERGRYALNSPCAIICPFFAEDQNRKLRGALCFLDGR